MGHGNSHDLRQSLLCTTSPSLNTEGSEVSSSKAEYIYLSFVYTYVLLMFLLDTSLNIVGLALRRLKFLLNVMGLGGGQVQIQP